MKKQNLPLTEEEINSLMRELQNIKTEDFADRAKIKERSQMLEQRDELDLTQLMARGGKVSHKKGGGFTYQMGGTKRTMSEYMKELLGGREQLEANFQGGGSIQDIMLMNINPMTAQQSMQQRPMQQQPMQAEGEVKKPIKFDWSTLTYTEKETATKEYNARLKAKYPDVKKPKESDFRWGAGGGWKHKGEEKYNKALADWEASQSQTESTVKGNVWDGISPLKDGDISSTSGATWDADSGEWINPTEPIGTGLDVEQTEEQLRTIEERGQVLPQTEDIIPPPIDTDVAELPGGGIDYTLDPITGEPLNKQPLQTYKQSVLTKEAASYDVAPEEMKWDDTKQAWVPKHGAVNLTDGDTWVERDTDDPDNPVKGGWRDDALSYNYDREGNIISSAPANKTMAQIKAKYEETGEQPSYEDWAIAWQLENPDVPVPDEESFTNMFGPVDAYDLPLDDPRHPDFIRNTTGPRPIDITADENNNGMPDYLEVEPPITPVPPLAPIMPELSTDISEPELITAGPMPPSGPSRDLEEEAANSYNMTQDQNEFLEDGVTPNPNYGQYSDEAGNTLKWNDAVDMWTPSNLMNLDASTTVKPKQTIKDLLDKMKIPEKLPEYMGGLGTAIKGLGPLGITLKQGIDEDEINYYENVEDASIKDIEEGMGVFDKGKIEARRAIERQQRQGINRLSDYVMNAQQRRAGARTMDVAAMEQMPLSDLRFDTAKSALFKDMAAKRFQGDVYDASGATARDDRLDKNRDAYYTALSKDLGTLGSEMQNYAAVQNQNKRNKLLDQWYAQNLDPKRPPVKGELRGTCSIAGHADQISCETAGGIWTQGA